MIQGFKKASAVIVAFFITPAIPVIALTVISQIVDGETEGLLGSGPELIPYLYFISLLLFFFIGLPVFLLLHSLRGAIRLKDTVYIGLFSGALAAVLVIGADKLIVISESYKTILAFCGTGALTGVIFWSILKIGKANVPGYDAHQSNFDECA